MTLTQSRLQNLQDIAQQGAAAYSKMLTIGQGVGALDEAGRDALRAYDDTFGLSSGTGASLVEALLDAADVLRAVEEYHNVPLFDEIEAVLNRLNDALDHDEE